MNGKLQKSYLVLDARNFCHFLDIAKGYRVYNGKLFGLFCKRELGTYGF